MKRENLTYLPTLEPPPPVNGFTFIYILACSHGALYIGSTSDLRGRLAQHGGSKGAKFTRDHGGGRLVYYEGPFDSAVAGSEIFLPETYFFEGIGEPDGDGKAFSVSRHFAAIRVAVSKSALAALAFPMAW